MSFTPDQWLILLLAFVLGLVLGMALLASPKWKARYREEVTRREELEAENERLLTVARVSDAGFSDEQGLLNSVRAALAPVLPFFDRHISCTGRRGSATKQNCRGCPARAKHPAGCRSAVPTPRRSSSHCPRRARSQGSSTGVRTPCCFGTLELGQLSAYDYHT